MTFDYRKTDHPIPHTQAVAEDPLAVANRIGQLIPKQFADLLKAPGIEPGRKLELVQELIGHFQHGNLSERAINGASPQLHDTLTALREAKGVQAAPPVRDMAMAPAPSRAIPWPAAQPQANLADALDYVRDRGPDPTPGRQRTVAAGKNLA
jgi:hypothetical protein